MNINRPLIVVILVVVGCVGALMSADIVFGVSSYKRSDWKHWITSSKHACWTIREDVLERDATSLTSSQPCEDRQGTWSDPYSGETLTSSSDIDIDHVVPLEWAHRHGASAWTKQQKQAYANDLVYIGHLAATHRTLNRSKGSKGPSDWKPPSPRFWCAYAHRWAAIVVTWNLQPRQPDRDALREMLATCERAP